MLEKFAEDDRIEQMNAQKRRMKQLEHKRAVEALIEDRRQQFQRERVRRCRANSFSQCAGRVTAGNALIFRPRPFLLCEAGADMCHFVLPQKTFMSKAFVAGNALIFRPRPFLLCEAGADMCHFVLPQKTFMSKAFVAGNEGLYSRQSRRRFLLRGWADGCYFVATKETLKRVMVSIRDVCSLG